MDPGPCKDYQMRVFSLNAVHVSMKVSEEKPRPFVKNVGITCVMAVNYGTRDLLAREIIKLSLGTLYLKEEISLGSLNQSQLYVYVTAGK